MKRLLTAITLFLLSATTLLAQSGEGIITGKIVDQKGKSVPNASVALYDSTQSNVITGASSDSTGSFSIDAEPGNYVVKITFLSFKSHTEEVELGPNETKQLGEIQLQPTSKKMEEVVVRGERSHMEMNFDKRVFDVGQDITSLGGSAINVLNNVPSISTDIDGNISLRGNESVRVLINGKPSNMVSGDVNALRSIPANMIKEVEIITNPSSKYAAEGSGGIINIILRKNKELGLNGSVNVGTGYPEEYEGSVNLNYRTDNVNWFIDTGLDYRADPEAGSSFQRFSGPDTTYMYRESTDAQESEIDGDLRFGADFYLSENEVLTASTYLSLEKETNKEDTRYTDLGYSQGAFTGPVLQQTNRDNKEIQKERDLDFNLEYENKIDGDDHKLTADFSFDYSNENANTNIREVVDQGSGDPLRQRSKDSENEKDMRFNAEYKRPLGENGKLEAGLRSDAEWMDTDYSASTLVNGTWQSEPAYTQNFLYTENVNAAYATLGTEIGDFSGQIGLRVENTNIRTELKNTGDVNSQHYINLFPSVFLNYSFNEQQSIQASYSRRLRRPWSRSLLPFIDFENTRSQWTGNPNLTPEFSNSYELGYLQYWESGSLLTSFYYRYRTDVIEDISDQRNGVQYRFPINFASEKAWGVEFSADQEIADSFTLTANANLFRSNMDGTYESQVFTSESRNFQGRMRIRWEIIKGLNYQASMRYRGPSTTPQGSREGMTMMDSGIAYDILDGKAKLSLNVRDVFDSQNFDNTVTTDGNQNTDFYSHNQYSWSSRSFSLNFQYFFGRKDQQQGGGDRGGRGDY